MTDDVLRLFLSSSDCNSLNSTNLLRLIKNCSATLFFVKLLKAEKYEFTFRNCTKNLAHALTTAGGNVRRILYLKTQKGTSTVE